MQAPDGAISVMDTRDVALLTQQIPEHSGISHLFSQAPTARPDKLLPLCLMFTSDKHQQEHRSTNL